jgi:Flp pilus assembly protein TadG
MLRLTPAKPATNGDDDGAIVVIVAVFLIVMVGLGSLVVDAGGMYWERRQLQNAADSGALALAAQCAEGVVDCATTPASLAAAIQPFVDGNANDQRVGLPVAMPHGTNPALCETGATTAANPLAGSNAVKVTTQTIDAHNNDATFLTHAFARIFGVNTTTVSACATAAYGYAASLTTMPLLISACEFNLAPDDGSPPTVVYPGPHPNTSAARVTLRFHQGTGGAEDGCNAQAGQDVSGDSFLPAGFGWLENDGSCTVVTTVVDGDEWMHKEPGANPECGSEELRQMLGTVIQLPVFNDFCRPHPSRPNCPSANNKDKYRVQTYASFYLTGYKLGGGPAEQGGSHNCVGDVRCIVGYFTTSTAGAGELGGPPGGVMVVRLTG